MPAPIRKNTPPVPARRRYWPLLGFAAILIAGGVALYFLNRPPSKLGPEPAPGPAPEGMVWIPGGTFLMGTNDPGPHFKDAGPIHEVQLKGFWMDTTEVTNEAFAQFAEATGYKTVAEQVPTLESIVKNQAPGTPPPTPELLVAGSLVFKPLKSAMPRDHVDWWDYVPGADWKHPEGPGSSIAGREKHPVVHVCWVDAKAYCDWAGKRLPTEAEWEFAARGGLNQKRNVWGDEPPDGGRSWRCNIWQGKFPQLNAKEDGFDRTAAVGSFAPNGFGLHDMAGNVWEWCGDWFRPDYYSKSPSVDPRGPDDSYDPDDRDNKHAPKRVQRGGSFLCSDGFCSRYRPAGRGKGEIETGESHVGFRCVK